MSYDVTFPEGSTELRTLGLIGDPLAPRPGDDPLGVRLATHSEALRLLAAIDASASEEQSSPVWVEKPDDVPAYYHLAALADSLAALTRSEDLDLLAAYLPLDMMVLGRARSVLSAVAEHLSNATFDRTLAAWVLSVLREPDASLPEAALLQADALQALVAKLESEPVETIGRYFGECVPERDQGESMELMVRIAGARQGRLEDEPADEASVGEEDTTDPMAEAFVAPLGEGTEGETEPAEPEEPVDALAAEGLPSADDLVEYVVAHTRAHLSPVVARGLRVYRAQGTSAMAQEFKVTKAPKKTTAALMRLARHRYRKVVLIYDRFDNWNLMPGENKPAIVGFLSELRWSMGGDGMIVLLVAEGQAPELAEQFASARRLQWTFPTLAAMEAKPPALDVEVVRQWLDAAAVGDGRVGIDDGAIAELIRTSGGDLERFSAAASAALHSAATRGLGSLDDEALASGADVSGT